MINYSLSNYIQEQQNMINVLYNEIDLLNVKDSTRAEINISFYNENVELRKGLNKSKSKVKVLTWVTVGLAATTTLLILK